MRPNFQDLSIQKLTDLASPLLLAATIKGDNISEATLTVRSAGKLPQEFLVINLQNVMVTSISFGDAKAQDRPQESISIKFGKIAFDYTPFKADGTKEQQVSFKWDVVVNKEL